MKLMSFLLVMRQLPRSGTHYAPFRTSEQYMPIERPCMIHHENYLLYQRSLHVCRIRQWRSHYILTSASHGGPRLRKMIVTAKLSQQMQRASIPMSAHQSDKKAQSKGTPKNVIAFGTLSCWAPGMVASVEKFCLLERDLSTFVNRLRKSIMHFMIPKLQMTRMSQLALCWTCRKVVEHWYLLLLDMRTSSSHISDDLINDGFNSQLLKKTSGWQRVQRHILRSCLPRAACLYAYRYDAYYYH